MKADRSDCLYSEPTLGEFFQVLVEALGAGNFLHVTTLGHETYAVPAGVAKVDARTIGDEFESAATKVFVLDLPLGWRGEAGKYRLNHEFDVALRVLPAASSQGLAFLTTGASGLGLKIGQRFQDDLRELGWSVLGYIELPKTGLNIGFQPLLAILSKTEHAGLFTASISDSADETVIAHSVLQGDPEAWVESGFLSDASDFRGFRVARIRSELRSLLKSESGFQLCRLGDFVSDTSLQRRKEPFDLGKTKVAISRILGGSYRDVVLTNGDEPNFKLEWIVASLTDGLLPSYFKMFMNSELGRMCLEATADGSVMRFVGTENLLETQIPIPSLDTQQSLVSTYENLEKLQSQIARLEKELVFNPKNIDAVSSDVVSLLGSIGKLTAADEIKARVRSGENKTTEFKETFSWDIRQKQKGKHIEEASLKTIAGFLNTDGGTLFVGVHDSGEIPGVDFEIRKLHKGSDDDFLLYFKDKVKTKLGEKFYPKIDWSLESVDGKKVLVVNAKEGHEPVFLDGAFYVRVNPATDKLEGERLVSYVSERFKTRS